METGKIPLTASHLSQLITLLPQIFGVFTGIAEQAKTMDSYPAECTWAELYEVPFIELITQSAGLLLQSPLLAALSANDPNQAILDSAHKLATEKNIFDHIPIDLPFSPQEAESSAFALLGLATALAKSMQSVTIHSKTLYHLIKIAEDGNDKALFDAVRIDRAIITLPALSARIHKAAMQDDTMFFTKLNYSLSLKTNATGLQSASNNPVRFIIACLHDTGQLNIPTGEIIKLFPNKDPDSLRRYINSCKQEHPRI